MEDVVMVLTGKSLETMFKEGGSGDWVASEDRVRQCRYIVATRHSHSGWAQDEKDHDSAFLIGRNISVFPSYDNRIIVHFTEYAEINIPNVWPGYRNPVTYTTLTDVGPTGIDVSALTWLPFPIDDVVEENRAKPLTIEEAKQGIAKKLGITKECIEITIRT